MSLRWQHTLARVFCLGAALTLIGCGVSSSQGGRGNLPPTPPKKTPYPTNLPTRGCSDAAPPANLGTPAAVLRPASQPVSATVKVGAVIQIHFNPNYRWTSDDMAGLSIIDPAGYFDATQNACVWNLRADAAGTHQVQFSGNPVAAPGTAVVSRSLTATFAITVTN